MRSVATLVALVALAGCDASSPSLSPNALAEAEVEGAHVMVVGLSPTLYLEARGEGLRRRDDLRVRVGGQEARVLSADARGIGIELSGPLPPGDYDLEVDADGPRRREDALRVTAGAPTDGGGGADGAVGGPDGGALDGGLDAGRSDAGGADADAGPAGFSVDGDAIALAGHSTMAIGLDGALWAWGDNGAGQLALGDRTARDAPTLVAAPGPWTRVTLGARHVCAADTSGRVFCAGDGSDGRLGLDGVAWQPELTTPIGTYAGLRALSADGGAHTCLVAGDVLRCWGEGGGGRLGTGSSADSSVPTAVGTDREWRSVGAGELATCATDDDGHLYCWGGGYGSAPTRERPSGEWVRVCAGHVDSGGGWHRCGLRGSPGRLYCWGSATSHGQLGLGSTRTEPSPARVGTRSDWVDVACGPGFTCGITADGALYCWGDNGRGQLGLDDDRDRDAPSRVSIARGAWRVVRAGAAHTCAVTVEGQLACWGRNAEGQLGLGDTVDRLVPTRVE